jgi:hypothetical protein
MTATALGTPGPAGAFVIASEPAPGPAAVGTAQLRAATLRAAPNGLICTPCSDGVRPRRDANSRRYSWLRALEVPPPRSRYVAGAGAAALRTGPTQPGSQ